MKHDSEVEHQYTECIYPLYITEVLEHTLKPGGRWEKTREWKLTPQACNPGFVRWLAHITRGLYYFQILRWLQHYPQEQVLVLRSEDYFAAPNTTLETIVDFLKGTKPQSLRMPPVATAREKKQGTNSQSKGEMHPETRTRLERAFHPYNKLLFRLLESRGIPFAPW